VIEHLADPRGSVREIRRILAPGGLFVVATPNHAAFLPRTTLALDRLLGIPRSHSTPPQHLHQFSTTSLEPLLGAHGFEALDVYHTGVALAYELCATGIFSQLKRAVRMRKPQDALRPRLSALLATLLYPLLWLLDRAVSSERSDATVNLIVRALNAPEDLQGAETTNTSSAGSTSRTRSISK
jgi:SAM-dependent methyltransferase